jgi:hypothetical protein
MIRYRLWLVVLAGIMAACTGSHAGGGREGAADVGTKDIAAVLAAHSDALLALPGVVGTAIGLDQGERCIKVLLADTSRVAAARIPPSLEGYRVVVEVTGVIRPR